MLFVFLYFFYSASVKYRHFKCIIKDTVSRPEQSPQNSLIFHGERFHAGMAIYINYENNN